MERIILLPRLDVLTHMDQRTGVAQQYEQREANKCLSVGIATSLINCNFSLHGLHTWVCTHIHTTQHTRTYTQHTQLMHTHMRGRKRLRAASWPNQKSSTSPSPPLCEEQDLLPVVQRQAEILSNKVRHWSARSEPIVLLRAGVGHE